MSINIGNVQLKSNVILAPMSGVTDLPYRKIAKELGAEFVISEMVASRALVLSAHKSKLRSEIIQGDKVSCVQLAGCDAASMSDSAKMLEDSGVCVIDINFGCPAKRVTNGYAGSYLMKDVVHARKIIESTVNAVKIPVTLKMRKGWDDENVNAGIIAKIAEDCGIKMITVHCRTRSQFYSGTADWSFLKDISSNLKIPVIVNGDIRTYEDASSAIKKSGASGVMIGRGCYGKPWFIKHISDFLATGTVTKDVTRYEKSEIIKKHYELILQHYGVEVGVKIARKHLAWYSVGIENSSAFRSAVNIESDHKKILALIVNFFEDSSLSN